VTATIRYTIYGVLFGCCFPLAATIFDLGLQELPVTFQNIKYVQTQNLLHWLIDSAPLFLGIFAAIAGSKQDAIESLNASLEQKIQERTIALERSNEALQQFSYVVSHDLKAPLRGIASLTRFIEEDFGENMDEMTKENFSLLKSRIQRMEILISAILDYSKIDGEDGKIQKIDTKKNLIDLIDLLGTEENIHIHLQENYPSIYAIPTQFEQVFQNLISNAIKYNDKEEVHIWITCTERNQQCEFTVRDNGPGIDEKYHHQIFSMFRTLQSRDKLESSGVGLTIVKKIIEKNKGQIWVDSKVGEGTSFIFTWGK
jgi:light-regulated signal transduction histidine kinase (bacteriophytochrome)